MADTTLGTSQKTGWPLLLGTLVAAIVVDGVLLFRYPYLRGNVAIALLALLTPVLLAFVVGLAVSGIGARWPRAVTLATRSGLALLVVADVVVFASPLFVGGATGHDSTPQFAVAATATTAPAATAAPTAPPVVGPFTFTFSPSPGEGHTTGTAILGSTTDGKLLLRLQHFHTGNGPNLHVFLSRVAKPTMDSQVRNGYDLGPLQATDGDKNYAVPANVDATRIQAVVIYCESFNALFGYASR